MFTSKEVKQMRELMGKFKVDNSKVTIIQLPNGQIRVLDTTTATVFANGEILFTAKKSLVKTDS